MNKKDKQNHPFIAGNKKGFTILEAMIAMLVLTIGILATASMQVTALSGNHNARQITEAAGFAADRIEKLRPLDYLSDAELIDGSFDLGLIDGYAVSYTVQRDVIIDNTMLIEVTVNWSDRGISKTMIIDYIKPDII